MNVFIVYAHPEPKSLNAELKNITISYLQDLGHNIIVSDLYDMQWKAVADGNDFQNYTHGERLSYMRNSFEAFQGGTQSPDIGEEQKNYFGLTL